MAMTFDGQRSSCRSGVEKTGQCAKEEVSSSLLGKLAPPFLCYKHIPSICSVLYIYAYSGHLSYLVYVVLWLGVSSSCGLQLLWRERRKERRERVSRGGRGQGVGIL